MRAANVLPIEVALTTRQWEHECVIIYAGAPSFFRAGLEDGCVPLSGFYCEPSPTAFELEVCHVPTFLLLLETINYCRGLTNYQCCGAICIM